MDILRTVYDRSATQALLSWECERLPIWHECSYGEINFTNAKDCSIAFWIRRVIMSHSRNATALQLNFLRELAHACVLKPRSLHLHHHSQVYARQLPENQAYIQTMETESQFWKILPYRFGSSNLIFERKQCIQAPQNSGIVRGQSALDNCTDITVPSA